MAERGYRIVAVELGPNLAALARRNLAAFGTVDVQTAAFEEWEPPDEPFDLAMSVTAFHWLDASTAVPKIAGLLRPGGAISVASGGHVEGGDTQFFNDAQECYEAHDPDTPPGLRLQPATAVAVPSTGIEESGLFGPVTHRRTVWTREFTTAMYIDELQTYSGHIALPDEARAALLACLARLIDERYNGKITKAYLQDLQVARRL
jgi:SAM-dependent methyltransferase